MNRLLEPLAVGAFLLVCGVGLVVVANARPLWYDELFTLSLSRTGPADLWRHLAAGVDLNPPVVYLATRLSITLFGEAAWAIRLPAMVGGLTAAACVYLFVRRRRGPAEAWAAMAAVTLAEPVWMYFLEARPFGLMCGFAGIALVCWQHAADGGRWPWAVGFAAALSLGVLSHYYFVLPVAAFGVGEAVRWVRTKRTDWRIAAGFVVAALAFLACRPLWGTASRDYSGGFWAKADLTPAAVGRAYADLAGSTAPVLVLVAVAAAAGVRVVSPGSHTPGYHVWEAAALLGFAAIPVAAVGMGAVTGAFFYRYAVPVVVGVAPSIAWGIARLGANGRLACGFAAVLFAVGGLPLQWNRVAEQEAGRWNGIRGLTEFLDEHAAGGTVLIAYPLQFAEQVEYGGGRRFRPAYVADPEACRRFGQSDTGDRGLLGLARVTPVRVLRPDDVAARIDRGEPVYFLSLDVLGRGWPGEAFPARGYRFEPVETRWFGRLERVVRGGEK